MHMWEFFSFVRFWVYMVHVKCCEKEMLPLLALWSAYIMGHGFEMGTELILFELVT